MKKMITLVLAALFVFGPAVASSDHATIIYELGFQEEPADRVEVLAYDCSTPECTEEGLSEFSGGFPDGRIVDSPENGEEFRINFPSEDGDYAVYFFAEGYIPQAWHYNYSGVGTAYSQSFDGFDRHSTDEGAVVRDLSAENMIYRDRALAVDVPAEISGEVESPLDSNVRAVDYLPRGDGDEFYDYTVNVEDHYRADTEINLDVAKDGNMVRSDFLSRAIYMDESEDFSFEWVPASEGRYEVEVWTEVVDEMFTTSPVESSSLTLLINDFAYQSLLDGLSVETPSGDREVGDTIEFSVDYRSYFDQDIQVEDGGEIVDETEPVKTEFTYEIIDEEGDVVDQGMETLAAVETKTEHRFSWSPERPGEYDIETRAEPVQKDESLNASYAEARIEGLTIDEEPLYNVSFSIRNDNDDAIEGATVNFNGQEYVTDSSGKVKVEGLPEGTYSYEVNHEDYESSTGSVTVNEETTGAGSTELMVSVILQESPTPPSVDLPDSITVFTGRVNTLGLDQYVEDKQVSDEEILWKVEDTGNLDIFIDENRTANIDPQGWTGTEQVTFTAEDTVHNLEASDTVEIVSIENNPPQIGNIGDAELLFFESIEEHAYLPEVVSDDTTDYTELDISLEHSFSNECGVKIVDERISIDPEVERSTSCEVQMVAEDEYGLRNTENFTVNVLRPRVEIIKQELVDDTVSAYSTYSGEVIDIHSSIDTADTNFSIQGGPEELKIREDGELFWDHPTSEDAGKTYNFTVRIEHRLNQENPEKGDWMDTEDYSLAVEDANESMVPDARIEVNQTEGFAPLTVGFDASNSSIDQGEIAGYKWDFGEGTVVDSREVEENLSTVAFTYEQPGNYTATLTVESDQGLTDTASAAIEVREMPEEIDQIGINTSGFTPQDPLFGQAVNLTATLDEDIELKRKEAEIFVRETGRNVLNTTEMAKDGERLSVDNISFDSQVEEAFQEGYSQATVVGEIRLEDESANIARVQENFTINAPEMEILAPQVEAGEAEFRARIDSIGDFQELTARFEYRQVGGSSWDAKHLEPVTEGGQLSEPVTLNENTEYEYRLVLSANPEFTTDTRRFETTSDSDDGDGDNDGGSDDGGSGSGGGSGGGGGVSWFYTPDTESIEDRFSFATQSLDIGMRQGFRTENITLNFTDQTRVNLGVEGNISEVLNIQNTVRGDGVTQIPVTVNATQAGVYTGNISASWEGQTLKMPASINVEEIERFEGELDVAILADTAEMSSSSPEYQVKIWDNARPGTFETVKINTRIEDSEGQLVYENSQDVSVGDVIIRDFNPGSLEAGEYTIHADATIDGQSFTGVKTVEVVEGDSITGDFTESRGIIGFLEGVWNGITSLFS